MKKLKIAIVTNNYTPYSGGVVSSINSFVSELQQRGHKVFVITLDFLGKYHKDPYYVIRIPTIAKFIYKKNHMAIPLAPTRKLINIIKQLEPDIIHTQHPFLLGNSAVQAAKKLDIPIIFTYHTLYEQYAHYIPVPQIISRPIIKKLALSFCKKIDGIIAPSNYVENFLQTNGIKTVIRKIPSGILPIFVRPKAPRQTCGQFHLLTVSRFAKEKNIPLLLDLFANISKKSCLFTFTLAGYGPEYENLKNYAYKILQLSKKQIHFVHKPTKIEIADLYLQSDLFIYSSKSDTQGLVLAEAMGCSCPIVSLDGPGQADIVKNGINGFLVPSAAQMAETIIAISTNKNLHEKLKAGTIKTKERYNPKNLVRELIDFYSETIEKKRII